MISSPGSRASTRHRQGNQADSLSSGECSSEEVRLLEVYLLASLPENGRQDTPSLVRICSIVYLSARRRLPVREDKEVAMLQQIHGNDTASRLPIDSVSLGPDEEQLVSEPGIRGGRSRADVIHREAKQPSRARNGRPSPQTPAQAPVHASSTSSGPSRPRRRWLLPVWSCSFSSSALLWGTCSLATC